VDNQGRTAALYLASKGKYEALDYLVKKKNPDLNFVTCNNETAISLLFLKLYDFYKIKDFTITQSCFLEKYLHTLLFLIENKCDFNRPIDNEGNTPILFFLLNGDYCGAVLLLEKCKTMDLSIKNNQGISASGFLTLFNYPEKNLKNLFLKYKTFDFDFMDDHHYDLIMYNLLKRTLTEDEFKTVFNKRKENHLFLNHKNENAIIMATKLGHLTSFETLCENFNVNHQDHLGNTALTYAIKLKDIKAINMLRKHKADPHIKNYQGKSPFDLANEAEPKNKLVLKILDKPMTTRYLENELERSRKFLLVFDKPKSKDEKLDDYVKNYQIKKYKEEYEKDMTMATISDKTSYHRISSDTLKHLAKVYIHFYDTEAPSVAEFERYKYNTDEFWDRRKLIGVYL